MSSKDSNKFEQVPALTVVREGDVVKRSWSDFVGGGLPTPSPESENASEADSEPSGVVQELLGSVGSIILSEDLPGGVDALYLLQRMDLVHGRWIMTVKQVPSAAANGSWVHAPAFPTGQVDSFKEVFRYGTSPENAPLQLYDEVAIAPRAGASQRNLHEHRRGRMFRSGSSAGYRIGEVRQVLEEYGLVQLAVRYSDRSVSSLEKEYDSSLSGWYARESLLLIRRPIPLGSIPERVVVVYPISRHALGGCDVGEIPIGSVCRVESSSVSVQGPLPARTFSVVHDGYTQTISENIVSQEGAPVMVAEDNTTLSDPCVFFEENGSTILRIHSTYVGFSQQSVTQKVVDYLVRNQWWGNDVTPGEDLPYSEVPAASGGEDPLILTQVEPGALVRVLPMGDDLSLQSYPTVSSSTWATVRSLVGFRGVVTSVSFDRLLVGVLFLDGSTRTVPKYLLSVEGSLSKEGFTRVSTPVDARRVLPSRMSLLEDVYMTLAGVCGSKEATVLAVERRLTKYIEAYDSVEMAALVQEVLGLDEGTLVKSVTLEDAQTIFEGDTVVENEDGSFTVLVVDTEEYPQRLSQRHDNDVGTILYYRLDNDGSEESGIDENVFQDIAWVTQLRIPMGDLAQSGMALDLGRVIDTAYTARLGD